VLDDEDRKLLDEIQRERRAVKARPTNES